MTYLAQTLERDKHGSVVAGEPREARSELAAKCLAAAMVATEAGAIALSRTAADKTVVLAQYGDRELADEMLSAV